MHWCLQKNLHYDRGFGQLIAVLESRAIPHSLHTVIPFVGDLSPDVEINGPVICIGSYAMRHAAKRKGWWPGVFDLAAFDYEAQRQAWPGQMLNDDFVAAPLSDILDRLPADEVFLRPIDDAKFFAGRVMRRSEIAAMVTSVCSLEEHDEAALAPSTLVMAAAPKRFLCEHRIWIVDSRVVAASQYVRDGRIHHSGAIDPDIVAYASARAGECSPLPAYVMDVASTDDGFRIVECNTFNAAGFYAADVGRIVEAIEALER